MSNKLRDDVANAGAKVARAKMNLALAERELAQYMQSVMDAPARCRRRPNLCMVSLIFTGANRINIIKLVREYTETGLKEALQLVDSAGKDNPLVVIKDISLARALEIKQRFNDNGADVEVGPSR